MNKQESVNLIRTLSCANGVSGFEDEVAEIVKAHGQKYGDVSTDHIRNVYVKNKQNTAEKLTIQLDAHLDEVGFIVQAIKPNGTLRFLPVGGWVATNIPAHKVRIKNQEGDYIPGIIASKPPHFMTAEERQKQLTIPDMVIDIGSCSAEETVRDFKIGIGAPVVPDVSFHINEAKNLLTGKAFDCRIGCAALLNTLDLLKDDKLKVNLVSTFSTQEEVGERGAVISAKNVSADVAIVFEGCPADDTFSEEYLIQSALRKGPMLRHFDVSMITNPRFQRFALDIAAAKDIPVQESVRSGGGTNGAAINATNNGTPAIVIGVPVRYAHTHYGYVAYEDYAHAAKLAVEIIRALDADRIASF